jgi:hypothetical protein
LQFYFSIVNQKRVSRRCIYEHLASHVLTFSPTLIYIDNLQRSYVVYPAAGAHRERLDAEGILAVARRPGAVAEHRRRGVEEALGAGAGGAARGDRL